MIDTRCTFSAKTKKGNEKGDILHFDYEPRIVCGIEPFTSVDAAEAREKKNVPSCLFAGIICKPIVGTTIGGLLADGFRQWYARAARRRSE